MRFLRTKAAIGGFVADGCGREPDGLNSNELAPTRSKGETDTIPGGTAETGTSKMLARVRRVSRTARYLLSSTACIA
jgi:hypothetical protein